MAKIKTFSMFKGATCIYLQILPCKTTCPRSGQGNEASCLAGTVGTLWKVNTKHSGVTTWNSCVVWNLTGGPCVPESQQVGIPQALPENLA